MAPRGPSSPTHQRCQTAPRANTQQPDISAYRKPRNARLYKRHAPPNTPHGDAEQPLLAARRWSVHKSAISRADIDLHPSRPAKHGATHDAPRQLRPPQTSRQPESASPEAKSTKKARRRLGLGDPTAFAFIIIPVSCLFQACVTPVSDLFVRIERIWTAPKPPKTDI